MPKRNEKVIGQCDWCKCDIFKSDESYDMGDAKLIHLSPCSGNFTAFQQSLDRINAMDDEELAGLIAEGKCPYEPQHLTPLPLGMFHCELCGERVVAGLSHPRTPDDEDDEILADEEE